ncbi:hypothetical protein FRC08_004357, partial [Ceratobasidium sp. 394]
MKVFTRNFSCSGLAKPTSGTNIIRVQFNLLTAISRIDVLEATPASKPDHRARSPTFGRSSDPVRSRDDDQRGWSVQRPKTTNRRSRTVVVPTRDQSLALVLPRSTPPPLP